MTETESLPGDKRLLFTVFFNTQRQDCVSTSLDGALHNAYWMLGSPDDTNVDILKNADIAKKGDYVASGNIGSVHVDVIYEEWIVNEEGGVETYGKLPRVMLQ